METQTTGQKEILENEYSWILRGLEVASQPFVDARNAARRNDFLSPDLNGTYKNYQDQINGLLDDLLDCKSKLEAEGEEQAS